MRDAGGRFMPGANGNPGGWPRGAYALREQVGAMAPRLTEGVLASALDGRKPAGARVRVTAAEQEREEAEAANDEGGDPR